MQYFQRTHSFLRTFCKQNAVRWYNNTYYLCASLGLISISGYDLVTLFPVWTQSCMCTRKSHQWSPNGHTSFSHTVQRQLLTHNLTMNQVSADQSAYKFKIQHLPSFYWRTFGTALFWPADTLTIYTHPKQKLALDPWVFSRTLMQTQTAVLSFPPLPLFRVFIQLALGSAWWENRVKSFLYRVQIQLGRFASPHVTGWVGGGGVASLYLCPLLHQRQWVVNQSVFLCFSSDWIKSLQPCSHSVLHSEGRVVVLFF